MPEPRPNFLTTFKLKLAAWLHGVAVRLEARTQDKDSPLPRRASGPPAHWIERVQNAAPELLQPGRPNFQARPGADDAQSPLERKTVPRAASHASAQTSTAP